MPIDTLGRHIDYLRISVTDRCNLRCRYCMPEEGVAQKSHDQMLSLEETVKVVELAAELGFHHIRLTGGEPLVRLGIIGLVRQIKAIAGIESIAMTTNGILLPKYGAKLKAAGLDRVNISLDSLDPAVYRMITRGGKLEDARAGIECALALGLTPVKLNVVVIRRLQQDFKAMVELTRDAPLHLRFIEFMPVGQTEWSPDDTIRSADLLAALPELVPVDPADDPTGWGPARYYRLPDAVGTVGFISSNSQHFCQRCNRLRLTSDGMLRPCLFSDLEYNLRDALRERGPAAARAVFEQAIAEKPDQHHDRVHTQRPMTAIGG
ncbi:MAG: GTP 3',8-cyclase MoaA [Coriobacteriales bacterium]|jgi:cyclic pyranopterin phosphate synthase|nr:GTP 3',8-cyclase MoaA [Coriobacteriales bacterium]